MRNGGKWTEARYVAFVKGALRSASNRWPPKYVCRKAANIKRGYYRCAGFQTKAHVVPATIKKQGSKGRVKNVFVDHIIPVVGPGGFTSWDEFISNLYCEVDNLQVLCKACHDAKSKAEKEERKKYGTGTKRRVSA